MIFILNTIILTAIAVSIDGLITGFSYGVGKIKIPIKSLVLISIIPIVMCFASMSFASLFIAHLSDNFINWFGFFTMLLLASFSLKQYFLAKKKNKILKRNNLTEILANPVLADFDNGKNIELNESIIVGVALSLDASVGCVSLAFLGASLYITPIAMGFAHFILVGSGNLISRFIKGTSDFFRLISVGVFVILAIMRLF